MASPGFYTQTFAKHDGKIERGEGGTPTPFLRIAKDDGSINKGRDTTPSSLQVTQVIFNKGRNTTPPLLFLRDLSLSLVIQPITRDPFFSIKQQHQPSHFILHSKQASRQVKKKEEKKVKQASKQAKQSKQSKAS